MSQSEADRRIKVLQNAIAKRKPAKKQMHKSKAFTVLVYDAPGAAHASLIVWCAPPQALEMMSKNPYKLSLAKLCTLHTLLLREAKLH